MNGRDLVLFDDGVARDWMPFALTRPAGELRFGVWSLRERTERRLQARCIGHVAHDALAGFDEPASPTVLAARVSPAERDTVFLSARAVLSENPAPRFGREPELLAVDGTVCGWYSPVGLDGPPPAFFLEPEEHAPGHLPVRDLDGLLLENVWELVTRGTDQLTRDILALASGTDAVLPAGVHRLGADPLLVAEGAEIEPGVVLDLRDGPIWIERGARIAALTRLAGPAYVGPGSVLLGGSFAGINLGPICKVHGQVEESTFLACSNKAHDGFIGHAYVGQWVNLGALTTNSDLKNNYGSVRLWTPAGEVDTGESKLGCFLGDHVKTAIGTLLPTGSVVGAGANLFGAGTAPKVVRPFAWGMGEGDVVYALDRFIETASKVADRRQVSLSASQREMLARAWKRGTSS